MRRPSPSQEPAGKTEAEAAEKNSTGGGGGSNLEDFDCPYVELRIALWSANDEGWLEEMKELERRREIIGIGAKYRTLRARNWVGLHHAGFETVLGIMETVCGKNIFEIVI